MSLNISDIIWQAKNINHTGRNVSELMRLGLTNLVSYRIRNDEVHVWHDDPHKQADNRVLSFTLFSRLYTNLPKHVNRFLYHLPKTPTIIASAHYHNSPIYLRLNNNGCILTPCGYTTVSTMERLRHLSPVPLRVKQGALMAGIYQYDNPTTLVWKRLPASGALAWVYTEVIDEADVEQGYALYSITSTQTECLGLYRADKRTPVWSDALTQTVNNALTQRVA